VLSAVSKGVGDRVVLDVGVESGVSVGVGVAVDVGTDAKVGVEVGVAFDCVGVEVWDNIVASLPVPSLVGESGEIVGEVAVEGDVTGSDVGSISWEVVEVGLGGDAVDGSEEGVEVGIEEEVEEEEEEDSGVAWDGEEEERGVSEGEVYVLGKSPSRSPMAPSHHPDESSFITLILSPFFILRLCFSSLWKSNKTIT
jgi:hypothetical protein